MKHAIVFSFLLLVAAACTTPKTEKSTPVGTEQPSVLEKGKIRTEPQLFRAIRDKQLTGMVLMNKRHRDPYRRYGIDRGAECYNCKGCSFYFTADSVLILNRCDEDVEARFGFAIEEIVEKHGKLKLSGGGIQCTIEQVEDMIWSVRFKGLPPQDLTVNEYFTLKTEVKKFAYKDCEGFEG